jgi:hypothetical protein
MPSCCETTRQEAPATRNVATCSVYTTTRGCPNFFTFRLGESQANPELTAMIVDG